MSKEKSYHSFEEFATEEFGMKPTRRRTNNEQKLKSQREKFVGICPYCKQPASFVVGTNVLVCKNEECKGKKVSFEDGTAIYVPYTKVLSSRAGEIGNVLFDE